MSAVASAATPRRRARRARRIGLTFGRVYLGIKAHQFIARRLRPPDMTRRWSTLHRSSAESIYRTALELRGLVLKGCQFAGARADVLPPEYVEVLSRLQDRVPAQPFASVKRMVETELGAPLETIFPEFEPRPVASASLAQVHKARLRNGLPVAVKVQYPEIASQMRGDLANLRTLFRAVGLVERHLDIMPIVEEIGSTVPRELDFENEARNAETLARLLAKRRDVSVPRIVWEHTTRRVLVMEFIDGIKITDVEALRASGVDLDRVASSLAEIFAEQILAHGFFHADPHPGNLLVLPEGPRIALLDFGLAKKLPGRFREGVMGLIAAFLQGEPAQLSRALGGLGFETRDASARSLDEVARLILESRRVVRRRPGDPAALVETRREIARQLRANPVVRIPHHLVLVGRVLGLLAGVSRSLGTRIDLVQTVAPYAFANPAPSPRNP